jgi:phosphate transport system substrate-binding protein
MRNVLGFILLVFLSVCTIYATACKRQASGQIRIDGSSTVFPITEAVAEEFQKSNKSRVTIGISGTGGGFKKFCSKETVIAQASRPITRMEVELCNKNQVEYIELPIAYDGIAVVVHPTNDWVSDISIAELKKIWEPAAQNKITTWNQIRPEWPKQKINLFAPGVDSGTYDYFTEVVVGKAHASRGDVTSSEDDNVLVQGVAMDKYALGFFGLAYYSENREKIKGLSVAGILPSFATVSEGKYQPLSRPIFIYVNKKSASEANTKAFVQFYLKEGLSLIKEVGYAPLSDKAYKLVRKRFDQQVKGSIFSGNEINQSGKIEQILSGDPHAFGS